MGTGWRAGEKMMSQEAATRQELTERVRHKHQRADILVQNVSNKLGVDRDFVNGILQRLTTEGVIKNELVSGIEMVAIVHKRAPGP
jgi:predicted ArsR family transcriptional regulator